MKNENVSVYINKSRQKNDFLIFDFLLATMFLSLFSMGSSATDNIIGKLSFFLLVILGIVIVLMNYKIDRLNFKILILFTIMVLPKLLHFDIQVLKSIIQLFVIFILIVSFNEFDIDKYTCKLFSFLHLLFCVLGIISYVLSDDKRYFIFFGSTNTFAGIFLFLLLCSVIFHKIYNSNLIFILNAFITIVFITLLHSRTAMFVLILALFFYCSVVVFCKTSKRSNAFFIVFLIAAVVMTFMYIYIDEMPFYKTLNEFSQKYFQKNIDSGRPDIWKSILQGQTPLTFIFGIGNVSLITIDYSAHNQFMQIFSETGIIGILSFIFILFLIWNRYSKFSKDQIVKLCMVFLLVIIVYNCFETSLIQNKFAIGCFEWLILSLGLGRTNQLSKMHFYGNINFLKKSI